MLPAKSEMIVQMYARLRNMEPLEHTGTFFQTLSPTNICWLQSVCPGDACVRVCQVVWVSFPSYVCELPALAVDHRRCRKPWASQHLRCRESGMDTAPRDSAYPQSALTTTLWATIAAAWTMDGFLGLGWSDAGTDGLREWQDGIKPRFLNDRHSHSFHV